MGFFDTLVTEKHDVEEGKFDELLLGISRAQNHTESNFPRTTILIIS